MANPLIDNITWNVNNEAASAADLLDRLEQLQAEWDSKTTQIIQVNSDGFVEKSVFENAAIDLGINPQDENIEFVLFNPDTEEVISTYKNINGIFQSNEAAYGPGKTRLYYVDNVAGTMFDADTVVNLTFDLYYDSYVIFHFPLYQSGQNTAARSYMMFQAELDAANVLGDYTAANKPFVNHFYLQNTTAMFYYLHICYPDLIPAGSHTFTITIRYDSTHGAAIAVNEAAFTPMTPPDAPAFYANPMSGNSNEYLPPFAFFEIIAQ